jgi:tetratricopeptide (TPR) repeat protein
VPSFRSARDNLVGTFKGGRRDLVLVMGEHDLPTVVSLNGALKETISTRAPAGLTCRLRVIENGEHVPPDALVEGLRMLFQGWKITRPLSESSFAEIRAQVDGRLEKFGVPGKIDEDALKGLGESLLGAKKLARALEVLEYRATSYPQSADAQVGLGDAYRQNGNLDKARECYKRALVIAPGHAAATAKLKGDGTFTGYIDQAPPEHSARVFRLQTHEGYFAGDRIAISADGKELYYTEVTNTWSDYNIRYYKYSDQKWNGPFDLFSGFLGPALSVDNKTMFFEKYNDSRTCWHSKRSDTGWSTPTLCTELPDPKDKHYLRDTASGRIYASSRGALNGIGQMDISTYVKTDAKGAYHSLGRPLNSPGNEGDFYVARDESFIVFGSPHRGGCSIRVPPISPALISTGFDSTVCWRR